MFIFLSILVSLIVYIVMAGATHGYAKHRWPPKTNNYYKRDENEETRLWATILWPGYWVFVWPFTKTNEVTYTHIEKESALQIARNKARVADLQATRAAVEASNAELEQAEVELEKEVNKL